ncbi:MAG: hypothetical protein H0X40_07005 [Chthoniobacterales bacterium]|nr:hypothetical protein [Chthoniobacterales bacterium]
MKEAIVGVCYDSRQGRILEVTLPSWRRYSERHSLPMVILEKSYAGEDFYWNKHVLYRAPELRRAERLLFLDNDVFINAKAESLLEGWESPLIGITSESAQAGWSPEFVASYYEDYAVDQSRDMSGLQILNTGVLVIPREQAEFLEGVYESWRARKRTHLKTNDPFAHAADQPHVSYALQAENRFQDFGAGYNTLWWHWYRQHISPRQMPFLLRSKAAALTIGHLARPLWRNVFRHERATFARGLENAQFLHVAGSKSSLYLGEGYCQ